MKYLWLLTALWLFQETKVTALTIADVRVSITSDSAAAAREEALRKAHEVAFQKLVKEYFPESSCPCPCPPPPQDALENMVTTFSIDKEKTSPKGYTAALTFQFDESQVQTWLQQTKSSVDLTKFSSQPFKKEGIILKATVAFNSFSQWQHIKKILETSQGIQKVKINTLSCKNAAIDLTYGGDIAHLQDHLSQHKLFLTPQGEEWELSLTTTSPLSKAAY